MTQHDVQHGHEQGDAPLHGQPGPGEHGRGEHEQHAQQPDLAEHEAAVPSTTTNGTSETGPDVAEHEAVVPSSVEDDSPGGPAHAATDTPDAAERSGTAVPPTGDDRVDEALSRLAEMDRLDVTQHAEVVEDVHRALQDTLAEEEE